MELLRYRPKDVDGFMKGVSKANCVHPSCDDPGLHKAVVRYCDDPGRGKGLFAARDLEAGELILIDNPLLVLQQAGPLSCAVCCRVCVVEYDKAATGSASAAASIRREAGKPQRIVFCSRLCVERARESLYLGLIYPEHDDLRGTIKQEHSAAAKFLEHASYTNPTFVMAARGIAAIIGKWRHLRSAEATLPHVTNACQFLSPRLPLPPSLSLSLSLSPLSLSSFLSPLSPSHLSLSLMSRCVGRAKAQGARCPTKFLHI